jgi:regulator of Ty1 transposition protein 109
MNGALGAQVAAAVSKELNFKLHHISTPPAVTEALCPAVLPHRPLRTYCEKQFIAISTDVLLYALEIYIYTTATTTTIYVSKADSSGYCPGLPLKSITSAVLAFLVACRRRDDVPLVISLFGRAQGQYLFPGSVNNPGKHVLDDRSLVRWWAKVLQPLLESAPAATGYLLVPGLDHRETSALLPSEHGRWITGHPLDSLYGHVPVRCRIPHFPDDPKARFLDELNSEIEPTPAATWKSVTSLGQFWDLMSFRQECSAGRMVGFLWSVYEATVEPSQLPDERWTSKKRKLTGPICTRRAKRRTTKDCPTRTPHYYWPIAGRGASVVDAADYARITSYLLRLDFATLELAIGSTERWINEAGLSAGEPINGQLDVHDSQPPPTHTTVNVLSGTVLRRKAKTGC